MDPSQPAPSPLHPLGATTDLRCCPRFEPTAWDEKTLHWDHKLFIKDHVRALFHAPLGLEKLFSHEEQRIAQAQAAAELPIVLSDESSLFGADYYFAVSKHIPGANTAELSGEYLTKVFEGPYRNVSRWMEAMHDYAREQHKSIEHIYFWYTTCPRCAQAYGKNYVVLFAKTSEAPTAEPQS